MMRAVKSAALVVGGLWVGVMFTLGFVVAPYLFILASRHSPAVPNSGVAAELIGPLLYSADVAGLVAGTGLLVALAYLRRRRELPIGGRLFVSEAAIVIAALCAAVNYWAFTPRIKSLQAALASRYGAFHLADPADPLLLRFRGLHETSTTLFVVGAVAALAGFICMTHFRHRDQPSGPLGA